MKLIFQNPERIFTDLVEGYSIAVKKMYYNNKLREMVLTYEIIGNTAYLITIHPMSNEKILNRVVSGRWVENE